MRLTRKLVYQHFIITSPIEVCLLISLVITHPLIFAQFYWLLYVTWCKIAGQVSYNNNGFFPGSFCTV